MEFLVGFLPLEEQSPLEVVQSPNPVSGILHVATRSRLMGERRGLNPRVVDSQSTALIHLATSAPTPAQVLVSIYDKILSEPPYDRYQREAFSYTITIVVASIFLVFWN